MNITGNYNTQQGEMTLQQDGSHVKGTFANIGTIEGEMEGHMLSGTWHKPSLGYEGLFIFFFDSEGNFTGQYKSGLQAGSLRGKWNGVRIGTKSGTKLVGAAEPNQTLPNKEIEQPKIMVKIIGYEGEQFDGKMHGQGKFTDRTGDVFEGRFENDDFIEGRYYLNNNKERIVHEGSFSNFKLQGLGEIFVNGKLSEEGEFKNGKLNGKGKSYWNNGVIAEEGEFKDGKLYGNGATYHTDGGNFEKGEFKDGYLNGKGTTYWSHGGIKEEGEFKNGKLNGWGIKYSDGEVYEEGVFSDGKLVQAAANNKVNAKSSNLKSQSKSTEKEEKRSYTVHYTIRLTKAKNTTELKGSVVGTIFGFNKIRAVDKKTHDKGEMISRKIRVINHKGELTKSAAINYVIKEDPDVKANRAGTSTIIIDKIS